MNETDSAPQEVEKWITQYIICRDYLKRAEAAYKDSVKQVKEDQQKLAGKLQEFLDKSGVDSVSSKRFGTAYSRTEWSAPLADPDGFMKFVIANNLFDLLDRKANVAAVRAYLAEHNQLPTGCNLTSEHKVGVRRPSGK